MKHESWNLLLCIVAIVFIVFAVVIVLCSCEKNPINSKPNSTIRYQVETTDSSIVHITYKTGWGLVQTETKTPWTYQYGDVIEGNQTFLSISVSGYYNYIDDNGNIFIRSGKITATIHKNEEIWKTATSAGTVEVSGSL